MKLCKKKVYLQGVQKCPGHVWNKLIVDVNNCSESKLGNNSSGWSDKSPMWYFPTQFFNSRNLGMNTGLFPGVPDDFGGVFTTLHPDPEPPLQPLGRPGRRERAHQTRCSCAGTKYIMEEVTKLTCPTSLWDRVISHAEQGAHGWNRYAKLPNFSPSLHHLPHKTWKSCDP